MKTLLTVSLLVVSSVMAAVAMNTNPQAQTSLNSLTLANEQIVNQADFAGKETCKESIARDVAREKCYKIGATDLLMEYSFYGKETCKESIARDVAREKCYKIGLVGLLDKYTFDK